MVDQHRPKRINRLYHNSVKELYSIKEIYSVKELSHICIIHLFDAPCQGGLQ